MTMSSLGQYNALGEERGNTGRVLFKGGYSQLGMDKYIDV